VQRVVMSNVPWRLQCKQFGRSTVDVLGECQKWGTPRRRQLSHSGWGGKAEQVEDLRKGASKRGRWRWDGQRTRCIRWEIRDRQKIEC